MLVAGGIGFGVYRAQQDSASPAPSPVALPPASGKYVALGDSYTSSPRTGALVGTPPGCDRSDNNYPRLVAAQLRVAEFTDVSCSGATTANITGTQQTANGTNQPQLDSLDDATTLVTLGIGGNDVGFIGLAHDCLTQDPAVSPCKAKMASGGRDELAARITATTPKIDRVLTEIHERAPKAKIVVVGYPSALPDGGGCWPFLPLGTADVAYLRDAAAKFNDMLAAQAKAHGAHYADTATPSKGHDMCQKAATKWVEDLVPSSPALSLHPNANGERAMADAVTSAAS
ncbi:SGNH/GDSL hydrolase family protein [Amycolatopsis acidicola]|uniref:SGNH/GDSL hydrolase family protein n=1 Tax=Amycolatopsis acidicola TaxID=2596893 RepID=UPI001FB6673C|nr:SGNH/GDSL hydrolase family protein [Amycolatopsis acidicola]